MKDYLQELTEKYVMVHKSSDGALSVNLLESQDEDGYGHAMIIFSSSDWPGLTQDRADEFANRLKNILYSFGSELLQGVA